MIASVGDDACVFTCHRWHTLCAGKSKEGDHNENELSDTRIDFDADGDRRSTGAVAVRQRSADITHSCHVIGAASWGAEVGVIGALHYSDSSIVIVWANNPCHQVDLTQWPSH
jgi:hypothetical protein